MSEYIHSEVEKKWQTAWEESGLYRQEIDKSKEKYYVLTMLPYPSGDLHVGHWYSMTPPDAFSRFKRMNGFNVLFPMGFDAFGLPAENAAIKHNRDPKEWTYDNMARMRVQMKQMGTMFDWEREAASCDPSYYKWTQWFFKKLYELGLAYRKFSAVDFCPSCNTTLAREQVWGDDRHCERCNTPVIKKELEQWFFKITDYSEELLDFDGIDWPDRVRTMQTNWIGRSEGAEVVFKTEAGDPIPVFTTRPDTLWGATFMVMAPEHSLVAKITSDEQASAVAEYKASVDRLTQIEREAEDREKTGVFTGGYAINPVNGEKVPIWIADYVLMDYGSGAIMAVPAHDQRDFAFARKFGLEVRPVFEPNDQALDGATMEEAYIGVGSMINSAVLNGTEVNGEKGRKNPSIAKVIDHLETEGKGKESVNYRLRDWLISRQRFWGAPIPMVYCDACGIVPVPDEDLPVLLPDDAAFAPGGESPLKTMASWYEVACPQCGEKATRETDTMDTFMCSSWYQYRYLSPDYDEGPFDSEEGDYWLPVDQYTGGIEHATMHLIYTRFFTMAMKRMGLVGFDEPMVSLRNQGMVLGTDGDKMSKSKGNVVNPDELVSQYGADTVRTYLMFFSRWEMGGPWNYDGIKGPQRFLEDVWRVGLSDHRPQTVDDGAEMQLRRKVHQTMQKVTADIANFSFNTAIAAMMELRNAILTADKAQNVSQEAWDEAVNGLLLMLSPIAPHITEEIWHQRGNEESIHTQSWPIFDPQIAKDDEIELIVQVNGKVRDKVRVSAEISQSDAESLALASERVQEFIDGKTPRRVIYIKGRLVNIVI